MVERKGKRITAYIDDLDYGYLHGVADETGVSISVIVRCAIHDFLVRNYDLESAVNNAGKLPGYYRL
jgi:hypothetical protein